MVSGSQRCDWSQFDSHRLGWERAPNTAAQPPPRLCLSAWNWDRWLHSDRIIPNLVLIYRVQIIHFYNMTRKTSSKGDGLILGFHANTGLGVVLIIPDRLYHLKATLASKWDFITASPPWDFLQTHEIRITDTTDELWDFTVGDTLETDIRAILKEISLKYWWQQPILEVKKWRQQNKNWISTKSIVWKKDRDLWEIVGQFGALTKT